jgi:hypothetical protein
VKHRHDGRRIHYLVSEQIVGPSTTNRRGRRKTLRERERRSGVADLHDESRERSRCAHRFADRACPEKKQPRGWDQDLDEHLCPTGVDDA